jgi:hypothetical protein
MLCVQPTGRHCVDGEVMSDGSVTVVIRLETPTQVTVTTSAAPEEGEGPTPGRCCPDHGSWGILFDHLQTAFPSVSPQRILWLLYQANVSVDAYSLDLPTTLELAELVVRQQLVSATGGRSSPA